MCIRDRSLEHEFGSALLNRTNKGVEMTTFGEGFYYYAKSILKQVDEISKIKMSTENYIESRISIAIGKLIMRDDMIYQYYETIRARRTGIHIIETTIEDVLNQVEQTKADIGIVTINNMQRAAFHKLTELKAVSYTHLLQRRMPPRCSRSMDRWDTRTGRTTAWICPTQSCIPG